MALEGKVAIITGSTGGIGRSIAEHLSSLGAHVVVTSRDLEKAAGVAAELTDSGRRATPGCFLLEEQSTGKELIETVLAVHQRIDILVNNAISHPSLPPLPLQDLEYEQLEGGISANLTNVIALTARAYPHLKRSKGSVLNIGSAVVNRNMAGIPLYTIVKGALTQLTKTLASEWAKDGIRVNQINPGFVKTDAFKNIGIPEEQVPAFIEYYRQFHPLGRVGEPQDIGTLATFMVSDDASWLTGAIVDMDGGYSAQGIYTSPGS